MICKHEKYGTLLYHKQCDLVKALSAALGKGIKYYSKDETHRVTTPTLKEMRVWRSKSILIQEMIESVADAHIENSDDNLDEWQSEAMNNDEELQNIMDFVFGPDSDKED